MAFLALWLVFKDIPNVSIAWVVSRIAVPNGHPRSRSQKDRYKTGGIPKLMELRFDCITASYQI